MMALKMKTFDKLADLLKTNFKTWGIEYPTRRPFHGVYALTVEIGRNQFSLTWSRKHKFSFRPEGRQTQFYTSPEDVFEALKRAHESMDTTAAVASSQNSVPKTSVETPFTVNFEPADQSAVVPTHTKPTDKSVKTKSKRKPKKVAEPATEKQLKYARDIAARLAIHLNPRNEKLTKEYVKDFIATHKPAFDQKRASRSQYPAEGSYHWLQDQTMKEVI